MNIVFEAPGATKTLEQMVSESEHAVYVTRLWYIREVDPYEKILTGMTRDGTFLVENGAIGKGILNFRFNESLLHMLSNVVDNGRAGAGQRRGIIRHGGARDESERLQFHRGY